MECKVKWVGEAMAFLAETGSNHTLVMDAPPEAGGHNMAPRPMELLLAGAGGCTAFDVVSILRKGRHAISACEVSLSAERAECAKSEPTVFTKIHFHFSISGKVFSAMFSSSQKPSPAPSRFSKKSTMLPRSSLPKALKSATTLKSLKRHDGRKMPQMPFDRQTPAGSGTR